MLPAYLQSGDCSSMQIPVAAVVRPSPQCLEKLSVPRALMLTLLVLTTAFPWCKSGSPPVPEPAASEPPRGSWQNPRYRSQKSLIYGACLPTPPHPILSQTQQRNPTVSRWSFSGDQSLDGCWPSPQASFLANLAGCLAPLLLGLRLPDCDQGEATPVTGPLKPSPFRSYFPLPFLLSPPLARSSASFSPHRQVAPCLQASQSARWQVPPGGEAPLHRTPSSHHHHHHQGSYCPPQLLLNPAILCTPGGVPGRPHTWRLLTPGRDLLGFVHAMNRGAPNHSLCACLLQGTP